MGRDLVPLWAIQNNEKGLGFRQGVLIAWNPVDATNVVQVAGTLMVNLNVLNPSDAANFGVGDIVTVLTSPGTWGILGRMIVPGTAEAIGILSTLKVAAATVSSYETTTSSTLTDLATNGPSVTINVGPSGKVLVILSADIRFEVPAVSAAINTSGAYMAYQVSGANTIAPLALRGMHHHVRTNGTGPAIEIMNGASDVNLLEGLNEGSTTFTAKYSRDTNGVCEFGNRTITVMAI